MHTPILGFGAAATTSLLAITTMKIKVFVGAAAVLAVAGLLWLAAPRDPVPQGPAEARTAPAVASADLPAADAATGEPAPGDVDRRAVSTRVADDRSRWPVRLRGLHPDAPWTARLVLAFDGKDGDEWKRFDDAAVPDADGRCSLALPDWLRRAQFHKAHLDGDDPNYQPIELRWREPPRWDRELVIDVQVVARLVGRVVDPQHRGVPAARVMAFALENGEPTDRRLGTTNTGADGNYVLPVPPDTKAWVIAVPMREASLSGMRLVGRNGAIADANQARADLLPAGIEAVGRAGTPTDLRDLQLPAATPVTGRVLWSDGRPVARATVNALASGDRTLSIGDSVSVQRTASRRWTLNAAATTGEDGAFELPGRQSEDVDVAVSAVPGATVLGDFVGTRVQPPRRVELRVPLPVTLLVTAAGNPVPYAAVDCTYATLRCDEHGRTGVVVSTPEPVVVAHGPGVRSVPRQLTAADAGRDVELRLDQDLAELAIEFEGSHRIRNAMVAWQRVDGTETGDRHLMRDDLGGPFLVHLPAGRYRLRIGAAGGERNGLFLLPIDTTVDVPATGQRLTLPARFGGQFHVHATDHRGVHVAGTCRITGPDGMPVTGPFVLRSDGGSRVGLPGEILPGGVNEFGTILAPGDYGLQFEFEGHGLREARVRIVAREIADVRIRL